MIDFESFSNFWFLVDRNRIVSMCSQSLEASLGTGVSLLEVVSFSQPKISRDRDFFEQVKATVINFSIGDIPYPFRATAHRFGEMVLFVCWPFLTKIGYKKYLTRPKFFDGFGINSKLTTKLKSATPVNASKNHALTGRLTFFSLMARNV